MTDDRDEVARVASEMRHRMANTFQLMSALARMRGQRAGDAETRRQLVWMADAIGSLGALERHRTPDGVDFAAYLNEMTPIWRRRQGAQPAEVNLATGPIFATDQAASTLALIVQELVANALAHGFADGRPGRIDITLAQQDDGRWELLVADDGDGFEPGARERFGLWFVRSLAAQVRGEFTLTSQPSCVSRLVFSV